MFHSSSLRVILLRLVLLTIPISVRCFSHNFFGPIFSETGQPQQSSPSALSSPAQLRELDLDSCDRTVKWTRRHLLASSLIGLNVPWPAAGENNPVTEKLDALTDLPPITDGCVRIFFCRHGQTENNRLRRVQGARVDPQINDNGKQQAHNLGKSLCKVAPNPCSFFCSNLRRARMTAQIAAGEVDSGITVQELSSLAEVDFGPIAEGQPVSIAKAGMQATYTAWATGNIDFRPREGGDSIRDVMERAIDSISALTIAAMKSQRSSCVAVTHSTFLRILLSMVLDIPLSEGASMAVVNGGITVIDVPRRLATRRLGKHTRLFNGLNFQDIDLNVPVCHVIRVNESRHLPAVVPHASEL